MKTPASPRIVLKKTGKISLVSALVGLLASCTGEPRVALAPGPVLPAPPSVFTEDGPEAGFLLRKAEVSVEGWARTHYYHLRVPAGYNADKAKSYPLVVYLHGWGAENDPKALKDGNPSAPAEVQALATSATHPAFVYVPVCPPPYRTKNEPAASRGGEWNSPAARAMVLDTIRDLQNRFHIDPSRIYLTGFSMGGSGGWYLASEYHRVTGLRFAAVLRGAGWYLAPGVPFPEAPEKIAAVHEDLSLSPSWIHVGADEGDGYTVGLDNYRRLQERYGEGPERTETRSFDGLTADFRAQRLSTGAEVRLSVYRGRDHEELIFRDPETLDWLFNQHL